MKIMVIGNTNDVLYRFRGDLIKNFIALGHTVVAIGTNDEYIDEIKEIGAIFKKLPVNNIGVNILADIKYKKRLKILINEVKPDLIFAYTIKPALYSAKLLKNDKTIKLNVMFTGLGRVFTSNAFVAKIIQKYLLNQFKKNLKRAQNIIFQNKEDRDLFVKHQVVNATKTYVVNGSGINIEEYTFSRKEKNLEPVFFHAGRLMPQKGTLLFVEAAAKLRAEGYKFSAMIAGSFDKSFSKTEKRRFFKIIKENNFIYLGRVEEIQEELKKTNYVVYPSFYGEGVPRALLEALSCGKPIITSNRPGCKETITKNNGWLIENKSIAQLAAVMKKAIELDEESYQQMCLRSRALAEEKFDVRFVNHEMLKIMAIN